MTDIASLSVTIGADAKALDAALARAERELKAFERRAKATPAIPAPQFAPTPRAPRQPAGGGSDARAEAQALSFAKARAALARDTGDLAGAERILQGALDGTTRTTINSIGAQRQLLKVQEELRGNVGGLQGALQGLQGSFASIGIGIGASALIQFGKAAIESANQLEDAQTSLKAISGDTATYQKALDTASRNQRLFGGSLADNVSEMGSFVVSSRLAGVELEQLLDISQRLATLDPAQGAAGAGVALRELLSGNERSLTARFELPAAAIKALGDEGLTSTQKLDALGDFLDEVGISSDAVAGKLANTSQSYRDLAVAVETATVGIGKFLAQGLAPTADEVTLLARAVGLLADGAARGQGPVDALSNSVLSSAGTYAEYQAGLEQATAASAAWAQSNEFLQKALGVNAPLVSAILGPMIGLTTTVGQLTPLQFEYAKALEASGASSQEAITKAQQHKDALIGIEEAIGASGGALDQYAGQLVRVAAQGDGYTEAVRNLILAHEQGGLSAEQLGAQLDALEAAYRRGADAQLLQEQGALAVAAANGDAAASYIQVQQAIAGTTEATKEIEQITNADALAKLTQAAAAEETAARHEELEEAIVNAAAADGSILASAANIANAFDLEIGKVIEAINAYRDLNVARGASGGALNIPTSGISARGAAGEVREEAEQLRQDLLRINGTTQQQLSDVNRQLAAGNLPLKERNALIVRQAQLQQQLASEQSRAADSETSKATSAAKTAANEQKRLAEAERKAAEDRAKTIADINARFQEEQVSANEDYYRALLDAQAEYNAETLAAQKDLQVQSAGSRADFYDSLTQQDIPADVAQGLSAAYEAAFAEAQRLSQEGKAALAADYLALKQEQIQAEADFQAEIAAQRKKAAEAKNNEDRKAAEAEIARLEAIKKLRDAEFQARESNLMEGGDANVNARDEAVGDAEKQLQDDLTAAQAGLRDAATDAQAEIGEAARLTNEQYAKQLELLQQLQGLGAVPPVALPPTALPPTALPPAVEAPTVAPGGIPGATAAGPLPVADASLLGAIEALIPRLDALGGKLDAVVGGVSPLSTDLGRVRDAVDRVAERAPFETGG
jgi:hypothetical protein